MEFIGQHAGEQRLNLALEEAANIAPIPEEVSQLAFKADGLDVFLDNPGMLLLAAPFLVPITTSLIALSKPMGVEQEGIEGLKQILKISLELTPFCIAIYAGMRSWAGGLRNKATEMLHPTILNQAIMLTQELPEPQDIPESSLPD